MQRSLVLGLVLVLAAILGAAWFLSRGDTAPPPSGTGPAVESTTAADPGTVSVTGAVHEASTRTTERQSVAVVPASLRDDPEIQAGLCGWKGRVVDHGKQPVAGCGVRLYRGAMDTVVMEGLDLFADEPNYTPQYVAGETKTAEDGRFEIHGVWPRAFYVLFAGIGTDAPMHQLVTRIPSPGEVVDLGDIELPNAGVITGVVVDDDGEPVAGALVRAADLPGTLAAFFPVERFDPQGALLIREEASRMKVLEMPKWVKPAFDDLPIPSARTDSEGAFRLVGVVPGSNLLATTQRGFLSDMKPSIQVRAGQVKDAGRIKLRRGEELVGRVVDSGGKPVAGAEILAGSTLSMAPVDLAQRLGTTDAEGKFSGQGFAPGKVTVAARRGKGHTWVLAEPQAIAGDVVVTLPGVFAVNVTVAFADGQPVKQPRFRLLQGKPGEGAAEMHLLGFAPAIDLASRSKVVADGQWRIENLLAGHYTLVADAPGCAMAHAAFQVDAADAAVSMKLVEPQLFHVRVLGHENKPIRNARIFAEARGNRLQDMPTLCGHTDADGRLEIDELQGELLRVSAEHPRWGAVHGEAKIGQELLLQMQAPGSLRGTVMDGGKAPQPGKFSIAVMRRQGDGPRGPMEDMPGIVTPDLEGRFAVAALQPGTYQVVAIKALDALRSPGGIMSMAQDMFMWRDTEQVEVEVQTGQEATVVLEAGEKPIVGPTGTIAGSVTVDGKLATGYMVMGYGDGRRPVVKVDERGRFDLGVLPAGHVWINVQATAEGGMMFGGGSTIWTKSVELKQAEALELTIVVQTSSMSGTCYLPDGSPAASMHVQAQGKLKGTGENEGNCWLGESTDAQGNFRFAQVPEGTWQLTAQGGRGKDDRVRGTLKDVVVTAGIPRDDLRLTLTPALVVSGRVDLAAFATKPEWTWVGFYRITDKTPPNEQGEYAEGAGIDGDAGTFSTNDMSPGRYRVRIHAQMGDNQPGLEFECQDIEVTTEGLRDLVLKPGKPVR